jgi:lysozyme
VAAFLLLLTGALYSAGFVQVQQPDAAEFPVRGIDVSHHQGEIDWTKVAGAGIRFAYLKATEGRDFRDPRFRANWEGAAAAGLARGAYHFFTFCSPGREQAEQFLRVAPPAPYALPPVADVEFVGNCKSWSSLAAVRAELRAFVDVVERAWGVTPILYLTPDAFERVVAGEFGRHPVWIRSVLRRPAPAEYGGWLLWQFSESGRVPGIRGPVDLDVLRPGVSLESLAQSERLAPSP